jgi:cytochrome c556
MTRGQLITFMGAQLEDDAQTIAQQARQKDLEQLAKQIGRTSALCASCHEQLHWRKQGKS